MGHPNPDFAGSDREVYWRRKLHRLRFGAEPIEEQMARLFRVTTVLTAIVGGIGLMILAIFAAFEEPKIGSAVAGVLVVPIITLAWLDFALIRVRASAYLKERSARNQSVLQTGSGDPSPDGIKM